MMNCGRKNLLRMAKDVGASYVLPMFGVTLRKGSRDYFYQVLDHGFSGIRRRYESPFKEQYECFSPNDRKLKEVCDAQIQKWGIFSRMSFYEPRINEPLSLF